MNFKKYGSTHRSMFHGLAGGVAFQTSYFASGELLCFCHLEKTAHGIVFRRTVKNNSKEEVLLKELLLTVGDISFGEKTEPAEDYYYTNENARLFCTLTLPVDFDRAFPENPANAVFPIATSRKWTDVDILSDRICSCPYQQFPAILFSNYKTKRGLIFGSLSQDIFFHNYRARHVGGKLVVEVYSSFNGINARVLSPGEELSDELFLGETDRADDVNDIFSPYAEELRLRIKGAGGSNVNRHTLIWDSWNDGIYRDVSEEMLLEEARAVKRLFPNVEWFQLDDGYSANAEKNVDLFAHGLGVPYDKEGIDKEKFPNGLRHYADEVKKIGLRPAVWVGGLCPANSLIFREKPQWFLDLSYRIKDTSPLDPSVKEAREYMLYAFDTFIKEYGFEGIKLDFWTYAFEDKHDLLREKHRSAHEWREWFMQALREKLGKNGFVTTGCDISMGNPFVGRYFNNYRYGLDVGSGKWENVKTVMFWTVAMLSTHTGDLFIPNSDSIGMLYGLSDEDFDFWVNFQIVTRTLVEISGRFSRVDENDRRLARLRVATKYLNCGEDVFFAQYDYRKNGEQLPKIVWINSAFDAPDQTFKTVALFNADEEAKEISFENSEIGLFGEHEYEDVWTGEKWMASSLRVQLPRHGSRLFKVKK